MPPENIIRKPLVFWCFQDVSKEISGMKRVKLMATLLYEQFYFRIVKSVGIQWLDLKVM